MRSCGLSTHDPAICGAHHRLARHVNVSSHSDLGSLPRVNRSGMICDPVLRGRLEGIELFITDQRKCKGILLLGVQIIFAASSLAQTVSVPEAPQVRAQNHVVSLTLHAVNEDGRDALAFNRVTVPIIRVSPGDVLKITYINHLPAKSNEICAVNPCINMTNLHFHGLTVSPNAPQDNVLGMIAMPGQALHYLVEIPRDHPPGLF
jgi:hypothetical protein